MVIKVLPTQILPLILIIIYLIAAIVSYSCKDFKQTVYWVASIIITISVAFM
jgi:hypothetical protein